NSSPKCVVDFRFVVGDLEVQVPKMAERVGFEPTVRFPVRSLSRRVLSTAQSPLRGRCRLNRSRALSFSAIGKGTLWQCVGNYRAESMQCYRTAGASRQS